VHGDPPGFIVRTEVEKAASERGYRLVRGTTGPWTAFASTTAPGQYFFRAALLDYWDRRCPITGIVDTDLLRAPHKAVIGLRNRRRTPRRPQRPLLSAMWDAAFDEGLVTFAEDGAAVYSRRLSPCAPCHLGPATKRIATLTDEHHRYLAWHRERVFG
jgi:putative restriction endonuclease